MLLPNTEEKRQKMIEIAMQEKAPKMYRQMKKSGQLKAYLEDMEKEMSMTVEDQWVQAKREIDREGDKGIERLWEMERRRSQIHEMAMATYTEFQEED
ncbi:MAG TPA: hypothetical protein VLH56_10895 [Dissulfurispiraceae bacterium]|nr:hypothetical protein [Dissulfurispiraceae bacterium]